MFTDGGANSLLGVVIFKKPDGVEGRKRRFGAGESDLKTRAVSSEDKQALMSDVGERRLASTHAPTGPG